MNAKNRVRLPKRIEVWKPKWDPEIKGWTIKYVVKNKWRYEYVNDIEDLMQDAYLVYIKVCDSYPRVVDAPHFMALYKTSLRNMLHDKSREYGRKLSIIDEQLSPDDSECSDSICAGHTTTNYGTVGAILASGPPELRLFLQFIQNDKNLEELRKPQRTKRGEPRKNFDQRIASMLGIQCFPFKETMKQLLTT